MLVWEDTGELIVQVYAVGALVDVLENVNALPKHVLATTDIVVEGTDVGELIVIVCVKSL